MRISLIKQFFFTASICIIITIFQGCIAVGLGKDKSWYYTDDAKNIYSYPKIYKDSLSPDLTVQISKFTCTIFIPFFFIDVPKKKYNISLRLLSHSSQNEVIDSLNYTIFNLYDSLLYKGNYQKTTTLKDSFLTDSKRMKTKEDSIRFKDLPLYKFAEIEDRIQTTFLRSFKEDLIIQIVVYMKDASNKTYNFKYISKLKKSENKYVISAGFFTV